MTNAEVLAVFRTFAGVIAGFAGVLLSFSSIKNTLSFYPVPPTRTSRNQKYNLQLIEEPNC
jgi:hypothetical protein